MSKQHINASVDEAAQREARAPRPSLVEQLEKKLADPERKAREQRWLEENRKAIKAYNERIERDGPVNRDLISF